jgi:hypothetical protein
MNCDLCGAPGTRFIRANHESRGIVLLCDTCLRREKDHLRPLRGRGGCC